LCALAAAQPFARIGFSRIAARTAREEQPSMTKTCRTAIPDPFTRWGARSGPFPFAVEVGVAAPRVEARTLWLLARQAT